MRGILECRKDFLIWWLVCFGRRGIVDTFNSPLLIHYLPSLWTSLLQTLRSEAVLLDPGSAVGRHGER